MKKTIKKRAFVSAIAMLIVSAIVLTSSTFAWFSMSKRAEVSAMDLTVSSASGIQISANAKAWTSSLDSAEFFNAPNTTRYSAYENNKNLNPETLIPVSSNLNTFTTTPGMPNFFQATLNEDGKASVIRLTQQPDNAATEGLVAFDLFFKLEERTVVNFGRTEITAKEGSEDVLSTMRIAYVNEGNLAATATPAEAIALTGGTSGKTTLYEYDAYSRSTGAVDAGNSYGINTVNPICDTSCNGRTVDKNNYVLPAGSGIERTFVNVIQGQPFDASGKARTQNTDSFSFTLEAGVSKVRVYIWVEGQDIDCRNTVAGSELTVNLRFDIP